jgi:hypothetical protein
MTVASTRTISIGFVTINWLSLADVAALHFDELHSNFRLADQTRQKLNPKPKLNPNLEL